MEDCLTYRARVALPVNSRPSGVAGRESAAELGVSSVIGRTMNVMFCDRTCGGVNAPSRLEYSLPDHTFDPDNATAADLEQLMRSSDDGKREAGAMLLARVSREPFVFDFLSLLREVYPAVEWKDLAERDQAASMISGIVTTSLPAAFAHLQIIRGQQGVALSEAERRQPFEDFARNLWTAYKNKTQRALQALGLDLGFMWQTEARFDSELQPDFTS